jgi:acetyl-CoA carboxylase carboxyl transferase subunit alpha
MSSLKTPIIVNVVGEGGSGGALALGVGDHISMLEHSTYSVASPEACASIVWRDSTKADLAAEAMKLNAKSVHDLGLIDEVISEPLGGAHRSFDQASSNLSKVLIKNLDELTNMSIDSLLDRRYKRLMSYGSI